MTVPTDYQYNPGDELRDWRRDPALISDLPFWRVAARLYQYLTVELEYTPRRARWIIEQAEAVIRQGILDDLTPRQLLLAVRNFIQGKEPTQVVSRLTLGWRVADGSLP